MRTMLALVFAFAACRDGMSADEQRALEVAVPPTREALFVDAAPPPPPPSPLDVHGTVPPIIARFLRHESPLPIEVTLHRIGEPRPHPLRGHTMILDRPSLRAVPIHGELADRLIDALGRDSSYLGAEYGCVSPERFGIRLTRGDEHLDLVYIWCGHLLTADSLADDRVHDDLAEPMLDVMEELRRAAHL